MTSEKLEDRLFAAVEGYVERAIGARFREIGPRLDRHFASIEALEKRIAALERKLGAKSGGVPLQRAGE